MKIGNIELTTTAEEMDEIATMWEQVFPDEDLRYAIFGVTESERTGAGRTIEGFSCAGILMGAELYRRRLQEQQALENVEAK